MTVTDNGVSAHEFVQASVSELHRFAQSRLKRYDVPSSRLDADDVVQYTVAEVLERWNEIENPRQYMFTVARRYVLRAVYEGQRFTGERPDYDYDEPEVTCGPVEFPASRHAARPADEAAFERIMAEDLHAALQRLTPQQRRAVVLIELGDVSRAAAAAEMAVATGAVSAHRDRGLKKLRNILRQQGGALLTAAAVLASILVPWARGRLGGITSADGVGASGGSDSLIIEVIQRAAPLLGLLVALFTLSRAALMIKRGVLRRARPAFAGSRNVGQPRIYSGPAALDDDSKLTIDEIVNDLRRLDRQREGWTTQESTVWLAAVQQAYDERLRLVCRRLGVTEYLQPLEGLDRNIERLRIEGELQAAGVALRP